MVVTYTTRFTRRPPPLERPEEGTPRLARITRLLALAHRIESMIRCGDLQDWAHAARAAGVTRARMTQIANLLLLAPEIQESFLLQTERSASDTRITERALRPVLSEPVWHCQLRRYAPIRQG